ncbi:MAG: ERF family protein, partial [Pseudomonadota bacterium]
QGESANAAVMLAMQKGYSPEFIEKMMTLQERFEKNEARKAFFDALANFKAEAPPVKKDAFNRQFNSWYTSLGMLLDTYGPVLGKHGLSVSFPPKQEDEKSMTVECRLSHRLGHTESLSMTGPIDTAPIGKESGRAARNPLQNIKSTFTYLRSATCEAILGVAGTEATENDDGNWAGTQFITTDQAKEIDKKIKEVDADRIKFFAYMGAASVEAILATDYNKAMTALKAKEKSAKTERAKKDAPLFQERQPGEDDDKD